MSRCSREHCRYSIIQITIHQHDGLQHTERSSQTFLQTRYPSLLPLPNQSNLAGDSDLITVYNAYTAWKRTRSNPNTNEYVFCRKNFLSIQTLLNIEDVKLQLIVSIADAGLIQLDQAQKTSLNKARNRSGPSFVFSLPPEYDTNNTNDLLINAITAWSFYPKLLVREGKGWRNVSNNQAVSLHPSSVNKSSDPGVVKWVSYYHLMQGRNRTYNAFETSATEDFIVALLCGDLEVKVRTSPIPIPFPFLISIPIPIPIRKK